MTGQLRDTGIDRARLATLHAEEEQRYIERHPRSAALAAALADHAAPAPPAGTHPEDFLAAVLAERRERDMARMRADVARKDALLRRSP